MKYQLDATLCRFYFCRVTLHVSGARAHHQEYLKLVQRSLVHVLSLQVSHHISLLGPELPALIRRCVDWSATITHVPVTAVLVLNTPDDGLLRPKHVEWPCRNKTCTVLHQFGVSFDLYYDARKHKIKIWILCWAIFYIFWLHLPLKSKHSPQGSGLNLCSCYCKHNCTRPSSNPPSSRGVREGGWRFGCIGKKRENTSYRSYRKHPLIF